MAARAKEIRRDANLNIRLPREKLEHFKKVCWQRGSTVTQIVEEYMERELAEAK